ncbi:raftlin isoform X2 [Electrophorus electricus]|uniref:raftlin isoform X2 n=1 Tax=Electrophorus electricus TaxID=8005 RepID=UPI0015CFD900|nr:raftlin isoform X2 [Electrophorus electricus]
MCSVHHAGAHLAFRNIWPVPYLDKCVNATTVDPAVTTLDLQHGYWQKKAHEKSFPHQAFITQFSLVKTQQDAVTSQMFHGKMAATAALCLCQLKPQVQRCTEMGCQLPKPRGSDEAPGKIYSTLRKGQVETRTGVAYTYHFLDFLLGKEEVAVSSLLCLSSVRELPVQVCEFYQQGFMLAAVHPFVHSSGPAGANLQRQLHRAVLIREAHRCSENGLLKCVRPRLETDVCFSGLQVPEPEAIQSYVKKVQDLADSGVLFTGFLQQPGTGVSFLGHWDPEHSSPSPINQHTVHHALSHCSNCPGQGRHLNHHRNKDHRQDCPSSMTELQNKDYQKCDQTYSESLRPKYPEHVMSPDTPGEGPETTYFLNRMQVFALYNHAVVLSGSPRFYSLRIPLQVHKEAGIITTVDAHWLDHMTQHFRSGAQLIDGYFHLGDDTGSSSTMESVFIFQRASNDIMTTTTYDAIVVEQWTIIDGVAVKTDYIPLLQTLALYGWRLMCVLPTPIVKMNSDGSLATKQILFLQRPVLSRKRRDFTRLHLKGCHKRSLNSKKTVGKETLNVESSAVITEKERAKMPKERESRRTSEGETSSRLSTRGNSTHRTPAVVQYNTTTQEEKAAGKSASTNQDAKEGVTRAKDAKSIVSERALFSGVC